MVNDNFKNNLRYCRKCANLSQAELGNLINVSNKTISHWEQGYSEPSLNQLGLLRKTFNVSYEDLLDE